MILKRHLGRLLTLFVVLLSTVFADDEEHFVPHERLSHQIEMEDEGYTINFKNVSIIEFIHFASKVAGVNFIFQEEDLDFNVTVVSEEPTNITNVISALVQVLRANGFEVLDQDQNLVITKTPGGAKLAQVVSDEVPLTGLVLPQIVTRVFRIQNANPAEIGALITPMLSAEALIEIAPTSRHLIVTDATANVEKIADIMTTLDAPQSALTIDSYKAEHSHPQELVAFATQIVTPIAEGNPVIMVPQDKTSTIFVISTPYLVNRTLSILEDLDSPLDLNATQKANLLSGESFLLYKIKYKPYDQIEEALEKVSEHLEERGYDKEGLIATINESRYIEESNSILFTGPPEVLEKLKEVLAEIDMPQPGQAQEEFFMYNPKYRTGEELLASVKDLAQSLDEAHLADSDFVYTLESARWVPSTHSLVFTGDPQSLARVQQMIQVMDSPQAIKQGQDIIYVYKINTHPYALIKQGLENFADKLDHADPLSREIKETIADMEYLPESNSIVFKGPAQAIDKIKEVLVLLDGPGSVVAAQRTYYIYKAQNISGQVLIQDLNRVSKNLRSSGVDNIEVLEAIQSIEYIQATNSLLITGTPQAIERVVELLEKFDVNRGASQASQYYMYQPKNKSAQDIQGALNDIADDLVKSGLANPDLINTISSSRYVAATNSLLFTGTPESIQEVQNLLQTLDSALLPGVQRIGETTFLIYKIKYASGPQLLSSLKAVTGDLKRAEADQSLIDTLNNARYIAETNSIIFTGPPETLQKAEALAERFDIPALAPLPPERPSPEIFRIYKPRCVPGEELIHIMHDFQQNLIESGVTQHNLFDTINNLKWIPRTNSILISGDEQSVDEVLVLLQRFDAPSSMPHMSEIPPPLEPFDDVSFLIYKLHYHQGTEIQEAMKEIATELQKASQAASNSKLIDAINSIQWIQITNSLIATGDPATLAKLRELLQNIDVPLRQIFIEVLALDTEVSDLLDFGLTWASQGKITNRIGFGTGSFPETPGFIDNSPSARFGENLRQISATRTPTGTDVPFTTGFDLGIIGDLILHKGRSYAALGSLINAVKGDNSSTIVLNQKIITQDSRNSVIFVGQNIPFTGSTVTTVGNSSQQTTANLEYRDVGFNLSITPNIGDNNLITLDIDTEISDTVGPVPDTATTNVQGITTNRTTTTTRVHVPNGAFLVLSGQIRNSTTRSRTGIPCLGSIPVVGAAFSRQASFKEKKNIMIFLRPQIVDEFETYKDITERQEELSLLEGNEDDVEEALELAKTPDDE